MDKLISERAAIDIVRYECGEWTGLAKEIVKQFSGLPAQPRKPGSWVRWFEKVEEETSTAYIPRCKCSECLTQVDAHASRFMNYCPYCGTQMENGGNNG